MKMLKKISALIAAVSVFGSIAMAADLKFSDKIEVAADAEQVVVDFYVADGIPALGDTSVFIITYDKNVYTFNSEDSVLNYDANLQDTNNGVQWQTPDGKDVAIGDEKCLVKLAFDVKSGQNPIGTSFGIDADNSLVFGPSYDPFYELPSESITVTAAGPVGPTATKVGETSSKGVTAYTVSTLADQKVMMSQKFTQQVIKPETRVLITYNGETREFGSDLYDKLGGQGGGEVTIGSLTFGLLVDGNATADQFSFEIK